MTSIVRTQSLTVASGATVSTIFSASGYTAFGMLVPSTFDGTSVTFEVSDFTASAFTALYSAANTVVSMTIGVSRAYPLPAELTAFPNWRFITPAQTGATVFTVFGKSQ